MASFRKVGKNWHYRFIDADGKQVGRKGCPDKRETEGMAAAAEAEAANIKHGFIDPKARAYRDHESDAPGRTPPDSPSGPRCWRRMGPPSMPA